MVSPALPVKSAQTPSKAWLPTLGLLLIAAAAAAAWLSWKTPYGFDDAWITYRYSRNIALGHGYVYNLGERVQGTSTPLYTLWLALAGCIGGWQAIPLVSSATGLLGFCLSAVLLFLVGERVHSRLAGILAVALFLTSPGILRTATSGMETCLYCALILFAFYLYLSQRLMGAFLAAGLCALTRLDGGLVLAALTAAYLIERRHLPWRVLALPAALLAGWFLFAFLYFGSILPASFIAKQYHTSHHRLSLWMLKALVQDHVIFLAALAGTVVLLKTATRQTLPLALWSAVYVLAYSVSELDVYPWYISPVLPLLYLAAGAGLSAAILGLFRYTVKPMGRAGEMPLRRIVIAAAAALAYAGAGWHFFPQWKYSHVYPGEAARWQGTQYAAQHMQAGALDVSGGIGMIGWFHDGPIVDVAGLVSPQTLHRFPQPYFTNALAWSVAAYRPPYVFESVLTDPGWPQVVKDHYHVVRSFPVVPLNPAEAKAYFVATPFVLWERNSQISK